MSSYFTDLAQQYIDGEWRPGTGSWDIIDFNPYDGEKLASITIATVDEVDQAYRGAERAQTRVGRDQPLRATRGLRAGPADHRGARAGDRRGDHRRARRDPSQGRVRGATSPRSSSASRSSSRVRPEGRILPSPVDGKENRVYRAPGRRRRRDQPLQLPLPASPSSRSPRPSRSATRVVLKPHQNTPIVGGALVAKIFEDAGLPAGLLNVVVTDIAEIGDALLEHPIPKVISFTGSDKVGRHVGAVAARHFKRTVLELGGNSALVVLDDADIDYAVDAAVFSRYVHQGQVCMAANRILVDRSVAEEFTEKFIAKVRSPEGRRPAATPTPTSAR